MKNNRLGLTIAFGATLGAVIGVVIDQIGYGDCNRCSNWGSYRNRTKTK